MWIKAVRPTGGKAGKFAFRVTLSDGTEFEVTAAQIQSQRAFQKAMLEKTGRFFPTPPGNGNRQEEQRDWEFVISTLLKDSEGKDKREAA